jgi:hypothetical protein
LLLAVLEIGLFLCLISCLKLKVICSFLQTGCGSANPPYLIQALAGLTV